MGRTITWLHISDLHAGKPGAGWDAERVIDTLVADLTKMEREHSLHPDFIFFTGDAAFGQIGSRTEETLPGQFAIAQQFFTAVRQAFSPEILLDNLFLVPGNHDLNREAVGDDQTFWIDNQKDREVVNKLIAAASRQWQRYIERFAAYREFLETNGCSHLLTDPERLVYAVTRQAAGVTVGIGGFNTAWSSCREGEKGKLWMGSRWQLEQVRSALKRASVSIVLMHHPANWLTEQEDSEFERETARDFRFVLHGHEHSEWVITTTDGHTRIAAGACYERSDKENGYNFVQLNLDTGQGEIWLRKYDPKGGGWVSCSIHSKTDAQGIWKLDHLDWLRHFVNSSVVSPKYGTHGKRASAVNDIVVREAVRKWLESSFPSCTVVEDHGVYLPLRDVHMTVDFDVMGSDRYLVPVVVRFMLKSHQIQELHKQFRDVQTAAMAVAHGKINDFMFVIVGDEQSTAWSLIGYFESQPKIGGITYVFGCWDAASRGFNEIKRFRP